MKEKKIKTRIFGGKHAPYSQHGIYKKSGGSVPKVERSVFRTKRERATEIMSFVEKKEDMGAGSVVREKICLDFYGTVGQTPSSRIALQKAEYMKELLMMFFTDTEDPYTTVEDTEEIVQQILEATPVYGSNPRDLRYATFCGKIIPNYSNLGKGVVQYIAKHHRPPETIQHEEKEYILEGLMRFAALAKILGDPDWLGGSGDNTGFVIKGECAVATLVDAGAAFSEQIRIGADSKNIQVGMVLNKSNDICFDALTKSQIKEFISTLYQYIHCEDLRGLLEYIVKRKGAFNSEKDRFGNHIILQDDESANEIIQKIISNISELSITYASELATYQAETGQPDKIPIVNFGISISEYSTSSEKASPSPNL